MAICNINQSHEILNKIYSIFSVVTPFDDSGSLIKQAFNISKYITKATDEQNPVDIAFIDYIKLKENSTSGNREISDVANALMRVIEKASEDNFKDIDVILSNIRYIPVSIKVLKRTLSSLKNKLGPLSFTSLPFISFDVNTILRHLMLSSFIEHDNLYLSRIKQSEKDSNAKLIVLPKSEINEKENNEFLGVFVPTFDLSVEDDILLKVQEGINQLPSKMFEYDSKTNQLLIKDVSVVEQYTGRKDVMMYKIIKSNKGFKIILLPKTLFNSNGELLADTRINGEPYYDTLYAVENNFYYIKSTRTLNLYSLISDSFGSKENDLYVFISDENIRNQIKNIYFISNENKLLLKQVSDKIQKIEVPREPFLYFDKTEIKNLSNGEKNLLLFSIVQIMIVNKLKQKIESDVQKDKDEILNLLDELTEEINSNFIDVVRRLQENKDLNVVLRKNKSLFNRIMDASRYVTNDRKRISFLDLLAMFEINIFDKNALSEIINNFAEEVLKDEEVRLSVKSFIKQYADSFEDLYSNVFVSETEEGTEEDQYESALESGESVDVGGEGFDRTTVENILDDKYFMLIASAISMDPQDLLSRFTTIIASIKKANLLKSGEIYRTLYKWFVLKENEEGLDWVDAIEEDSELLTVFRMILLNPDITNKSTNNRIQSLIHYKSYLASQFENITPVTIFGYNKGRLHAGDLAYLTKSYSQNNDFIPLSSKMMFVLSLMKQYRKEQNKQVRNNLKKATILYFVDLMEDIHKLIGKGINSRVRDSDPLQIAINFIANEEAIYSILSSFSTAIPHYIAVGLNSKIYGVDEESHKFIMHSSVNTLIPHTLKELSYIKPENIKHYDYAVNKQNKGYIIVLDKKKHFTNINNDLLEKIRKKVQEKANNDKTIKKYTNVISLSEQEKEQLKPYIQKAIAETLLSTGIIESEKTNNGTIITDVKDSNFDKVVYDKHLLKGAKDRTISYILTYGLQIYSFFRINRVIGNIGTKQALIIGANKPGNIADNLNKGLFVPLYNSGVTSAMLQNTNTTINVGILGPYDGKAPETEIQNRILSSAVFMNTGITPYSNSSGGANQHYTLFFSGLYNGKDAIPVLNPLYNPMHMSASISGVVSSVMQSFITYDAPAVAINNVNITNLKDQANRIRVFESHAGNVSNQFLSMSGSFISDEKIARHIENDTKATTSIGRLLMRSSLMMKLKQELYFYVSIKMFDSFLSEIEKDKEAANQLDFKVHSLLTSNRKFVKNIKDDKSLRELFKMTYGTIQKEEFEKKILPVADAMVEMLFTYLTGKDIREYAEFVKSNIKSNKEEVNRTLYELFSDIKFKEYSSSFDVLFDALILEGSSIDLDAEVKDTQYFKDKVQEHYNKLIFNILEGIEQTINYKDKKEIKEINVLQWMENAINMMYGKDVFSIRKETTEGKNEIVIRIRKSQTNDYKEHRLSLDAINYKNPKDIIDEFIKLREFQIVFNYHYRLFASYLDAIGYLKPTNLRNFITENEQNEKIVLKENGNKLTISVDTIYAIPVIENGNYILKPIYHDKESNDIAYRKIVEKFQDAIVGLSYHATSSTLRRNETWLKENVLTREDARFIESFDTVLASYSIEIKSKDGKITTKEIHLSWGDIYPFDRLIRKDSIYESYNSLFANNAVLFGKKARTLYKDDSYLFKTLNIDEINKRYFKLFLDEKYKNLEATKYVQDAFSSANLYSSLGIRDKKISNNRSQTDLQFSVNGFQEAILHHYVLNKNKYDKKDGDLGSRTPLDSPSFFDKDFSDKRVNGFFISFDLPVYNGSPAPFLSLRDIQIDYTKFLWWSYFMDTLFNQDTFNFINDRISVKISDGSKRDKQSNGLSPHPEIIESLQKDIPEEFKIKNGQLRVMVFDDFMIDLSKTNSITKVYGEQISELNEVEYFNGWGVIPLELFRIIAISTKEWNEEKERAYQEIMSGKVSDVDTLIKFGCLRKAGIGGLKPHNAAILLNTIVTGHNQEKYAIFPIHPNLFVNSIGHKDKELLIQIYNMMKNNGTHILVFDSGSKQHKVKNVNSNKNKLIKLNETNNSLELSKEWLIPKGEHNNNTHITDIRFLKIVTPQSKKVKDGTYLNVKFLVFSWLLKHSPMQELDSFKEFKVGDKVYYNLRHFLEEELKLKGISDKKEQDRLIADTFNLARKWGRLLLAAMTAKRNNISEQIESLIGVSDLNTYVTMSDIIDKVIDSLFEGDKKLKEQIETLVEAGINGFAVGDMSKVFSLLKQAEESRKLFGNLNVVIPYYEDVPNTHHKTIVEKTQQSLQIITRSDLTAYVRYLPYVYIKSEDKDKYPVGSYIYVDGVIYKVKSINPLSQEFIINNYNKWMSRLNDKQKAIESLSLEYNLDLDFIRKVIESKDKVILPENVIYRVELGRHENDNGLLESDIIHIDELSDENNEYVKKAKEKKIVRIIIPGIVSPAYLYFGFFGKSLLIDQNSVIDSDVIEELEKKHFGIFFLSNYGLNAVSLYSGNQKVLAQNSWILPGNYMYSSWSKEKHEDTLKIIEKRINSKSPMNQPTEEEVEKFFMFKNALLKDVTSDYSAYYDDYVKEIQLDKPIIIFNENYDVANTYYSYLLSNKITKSKKEVFGINTGEKDAKYKLFYLIRNLFDLIDYVSDTRDSVTIEEITDSVELLYYNMELYKDKTEEDIRKKVKKIVDILFNINKEIDDIHKTLSQLLDVVFQENQNISLKELENLKESIIKFAEDIELQDINTEFFEKLPENVISENAEPVLLLLMYLLNKKKNTHDKIGFNVKIKVPVKKRSHAPIIQTALINSSENVVRALPTLTTMPFSFHFTPILFIPTPDGKDVSLLTINKGLAIYWNVYLYNNGVIGADEMENRLSGLSVNLTYDNNNKVDLEESTLDGISLKWWYSYGNEIAQLTKFVTYRVPLQISASIVASNIYSFFHPGISNVMMLHPLTNGLMGGDNDNDKGTNHFIYYYIKIDENLLKLDKSDLKNIIKQALVEKTENNRLVYKSNKEIEKIADVFEKAMKDYTYRNKNNIYFDIHSFTELIDSGDKYAEQVLKFLIRLSNKKNISISYKDEKGNLIEKKYSFNFEIVDYIPVSNKKSKLEQRNIDNALVLTSYEYFTFPDNTSLYPVSITGVKHLIYLLSDKKKTQIVTDSIDSSSNKTNIKNILKSIGALVYAQTGFQLPEKQSALLYDAISTMISLTVDVVKDDTAQYGAHYFLLTEITRLFEYLDRNKINELLYYIKEYKKLDNDLLKDILDINNNPDKEKTFKVLYNQLEELSSIINSEDEMKLKEYIYGDIFFSSRYSVSLLFNFFFSLFRGNGIVEIIAAHKIKHNLGEFELKNNELGNEVLSAIKDKYAKFKTKYEKILPEIKDKIQFYKITTDNKGNKTQTLIEGDFFENIMTLWKTKNADIGVSFKSADKSKEPYILKEGRETLFYLQFIDMMNKLYKEKKNETDKKAILEFTELVVSSLSTISTFRNIIKYQPLAFSLLKLSAFNAKVKKADLFTSIPFTLANPYAPVRHFLKSMNVSQNDTDSVLTPLSENLILFISSVSALDVTFRQNILSNNAEVLSNYYKVLIKDDNIYVELDSKTIDKMGAQSIRDKFSQIDMFIEVITDDKNQKKQYININKVLESKNAYLKEFILKGIYYGMYVTDINRKLKETKEILEKDRDKLSADKINIIEKDIISIERAISDINNDYYRYFNKDDKKDYTFEDLSLDSNKLQNRLSILHFIGSYMEVSDDSISVMNAHYRNVAGLYYKTYLLNRFAKTGLASLQYNGIKSIVNRSNFKANAAMYIIGLPPNQDNKLFNYIVDASGETNKMKHNLNTLLDITMSDKDNLFRDNVMQGLANGYVSGIVTNSKVGYIGENPLMRSIIYDVTRKSLKVFLGEMDNQESNNNVIGLTYSFVTYQQPEQAGETKEKKETKDKDFPTHCIVKPRSVYTINRRLKYNRKTINSVMKQNVIDKVNKFIFSLPTIIDRKVNNMIERSQADNVLFFIDKDLKTKHINMLEASLMLFENDVVPLMNKILNTIGLQHSLTSWVVFKRNTRILPSGLTTGTLRYYHDINTTQAYLNMVYETKKHIADIKDLDAFKKSLINSVVEVFKQDTFKNNTSSRVVYLHIFYTIWYTVEKQKGSNIKYEDEQSLNMFIDEIKVRIKERFIKDNPGKEFQETKGDIEVYKDLVLLHKNVLNDNKDLPKLINTMLQDEKVLSIPYNKTIETIVAITNSIFYVWGLVSIEKIKVKENDINPVKIAIDESQTIEISQKTLMSLYNKLKNNRSSYDYKDNVSNNAYPNNYVYSEYNIFLDGLEHIFKEQPELWDIIRIKLATSLSEIDNYYDVFTEMLLENQQSFIPETSVVSLDSLSLNNISMLLYHMSLLHHTNRIVKGQTIIEKEIQEKIDEMKSTDPDAADTKETTRTKKSNYVLSIEKNNIASDIIMFDINQASFNANIIDVKSEFEKSLLGDLVRKTMENYLENVLSKKKDVNLALKGFDLYFDLFIREISSSYGGLNVLLSDIAENADIALTIIDSMFAGIENKTKDLEINDKDKIKLYKAAFSFMLDLIKNDKMKRKLINQKADVFNKMIKDLSKNAIITIDIEDKNDMFDLLFIFAANMSFKDSYVNEIMGKEQNLKQGVFMTEKGFIYKIDVNLSDIAKADPIVGHLYNVLKNTGLIIKNEEEKQQILSKLESLNNTTNQNKC